MQKTYNTFLDFKNKSKETKRTYISILKNYPILHVVKESFDKNMPLHNLLNDYIIELVDKKLNPNTIRKIHMAHRSYIHYLRWAGYSIVFNKDAILLPPKRKKESPNPLTNEQLSLLINHKNLLVACMCAVGYQFATRIQELHDIKLTDFSGNIEKITIQGLKHGEKITYNIPYKLRALIVEYMQHFQEQIEKTGRLFPFSMTALNKLFRKTCDNLGFDYIPFRALRHTRTHNELNAIMKMKIARLSSVSSIRITPKEKEQIQRVGRHKSITVPVEIYGHIDKD